MSTASESRKSEITGEAIELLDCFVSGFDSIIYELAESLARTASSVQPEDVVEIERDHVKDAALIIFRAIQEEAGKTLSAEAAEEIIDMHRCVMEKCKIQD